MADISALLNKIKNAIYGREMRSALHDSINAVNVDVEKKADKTQYATISQAGLIKLYSSGGTNRSGLIVGEDGTTYIACSANGGITRDGAGGLKITDGGVTSSRIGNGAVVTQKIADGAVTQEKIAIKAVGEDEIDDKVIVTRHIGDKQVTTAKLADKCITNYQLNDNAVQSYAIAPESILIDHLSDEVYELIMNTFNPLEYNLSSCMNGNYFNIPLDTTIMLIHDTLPENACVVMPDLSQSKQRLMYNDEVGYAVSGTIYIQIKNLQLAT